MGLMDLLKTSDPMDKFYAAAERSNIPQGGVTGAAFQALFPHGAGNVLFGRQPQPMPQMDTQEGTQYLADLASNMMTPGTFIGPKGMGRLFGDDAAKGMMSAAEVKLSQGVPREKVFQELGVFKGPEGKWRYEIDDSGMDFNLDSIPAGKGRLKIAEEYLRGQGRTEQWPLGNPNVPQDLQSAALQYADMNPDVPRGIIGQAVNHDQLFAAYPDSHNIGLAIEKRMGLGGSYDPTENLISVGGGTLTTNPKSTALHELQHAVQGREGFAAGGSPSQFVQQKEAEIARDALSWRNEVLAKRNAAPDADLHTLSNFVADEYRKAGAPDWIPPREARELALQPNVLFPQFHQGAEGGFDDLTELVKFYGLDKRTSPYSSRELYERLAGEAESRAVQDRMNMNMDERRASFPEYATRNDLIVRGLMSGGK